MNEYVAKIDKLRAERGLSVYKFAQESEILQTTLHKWFHSNTAPSIAGVKMACDYFGITLAEFFSDGELVELTDERKELFADYISLNQSERNAVHAVINAYKSNKK